MILVDTGAWLALADRGDKYHARCREFFRRNREPLRNIGCQIFPLPLHRCAVTGYFRAALFAGQSDCPEAS